MRLVLKTLFDLFLSSTLFILFLPLLIIFPFLIWYQDRSNPFYIANRVGKNGRLFKMIKFRTMIFNADKTGIDSTAINDNRITKLGHFIRRYKIDEIPSLINILKGEMSFVGPRPNVKRETDLYTNEEKILLNMKPGITDFSSIVFSDEGEILKNSDNPDLDYNQLIRPWKSRLGIFYVLNHNFFIDLKILFLTIFMLINREYALHCVHQVLSKKIEDDQLLNVLKRKTPLNPYPPPGSDEIIRSRL
mgnify:FL=1